MSNIQRKICCLYYDGSGKCTLSRRRKNFFFFEVNGRCEEAEIGRIGGTCPDAIRPKPPKAPPAPPLKAAKRIVIEDKRNDG